MLLYPRKCCCVLEIAAVSQEVLMYPNCHTPERAAVSQKVLLYPMRCAAVSQRVLMYPKKVLLYRMSVSLSVAWLPT